MENYIRFDWAMKRLLRNKANYAVLEGLLTTLFEEKVTIHKLLESESNQEDEFDKYNRVDMLAENSKGELVLIEQSAAAPCRLTVNAARIKARVTSHLGCVVLRSAVWIDNLAAALQSVPERDRAAYSAIKAIELLYLISTDSPLLTMPPESVSRDHYLTDTVRQVQEYMVSHLSDPLTIDQLSARFRISPTALKDIFRQTYGRPIHQYLLEKRVQHAAELLHRSPLSIVDIAAAVGYNSASQFGVAFKRRYQLTPSQYRRQARKS